MDRASLAGDPGTLDPARSSQARAAPLLLVTWLAICLALCPATSRAQSSTPIPDGAGVTAEEIELALESVSAREELDEATRARVVDLLRRALVHSRTRQSADAAAAAHAAALRSAPEEIQRLRSSLDTPVEPAPELPGIDETTPTPSVEGRLASTLVELAAEEANLASLEAEAAAQADRPAEIRERLAELGRGRGVSQLTAPSPSEARILSDARLLATRLETEARESELRSLEQEMLSHGVRLSLVETRRDDAERKIVDLRQRADSLQATINTRRQKLADRAREEAALAELAAADEHSVVRELAEENARLTRVLPDVAADIQRATGELNEVEAQARAIEQNLARALQRLEVGGVDQLLGQLLVEQRRNLPRISRHRAEMLERRRTLAEVGLAQMRSEDQRRELSAVEVAVELAMAKVAGDVSDTDELQAIREKVELLLRNRRALLQQVASSYASQARALNELDLAQHRLLNAAAEYEHFLDRNLLWIPSATPFGPEELRNLAPATRWLLAPPSWARTLDALGQALRRSLVIASAVLLALTMALFFRRSLAGAAIPDGSGQDHIGHTLRALALVALRAAPAPFLMAVLAWALNRSPHLDDFAAAVGTALHIVAPFLYNTLLLRALGAKDGVMGAHFSWDERRLELLRGQGNRLTAVGVPLAFVCALAYSASSTEHRESLGRLAFVLLMVLMSGVLYALLHPIRGIAVSSDVVGASAARRLGHASAFSAPLLLALASVSGYTNTALTLARPVIDTYWLVLGLFFARLVLWRWLALASRGIARQRLEPEAVDVSDGAGDGPGAERSVVARRPPDIAAVDQQSKRLLDAGLAFVTVLLGWAIWAEVLPALGVLDRTSLWSRAVTVDGVTTTAPVTLADLLLALLIAGVTVIAAKNLPGLMEIAFLQRLTLQPGSRYTINTLLRYVIVLIGTIAAFNVIGWSWSRIQWLAAAISVGLGFGLQEIVANFVSGLVILFERPVRVGDTVTVGEVTGTVSRVRIRATTIADWDRKEILVPNKSFITEQVINWTLTDPITRIVIPVGVAYGSDVEKTHQVMQQTLDRIPLVLDAPSPQVYFTGFGESSLDFKLYVYARQLSDRLPLLHAVHGEIFRALREHGIEIPFPQRDLHVKSVDDLPGR
ncbi:MAG: mechanosensitive ion channel [Holophagales bacterium]|nr:mechanosensitive ion channel [Holophagales bacterium]